MSYLALALLLQSTPEALEVANTLCVETVGDFDAFERAGDRIGDRLSPEASLVLTSDLRTPDRVVGYRVGGVEVVLANLPGGIQNVPAPIQAAGAPTRMWDFDFPHSVICRVRAGSWPDDWAAVVEGWTPDGARLSPLRTGQTNERSWTFPGWGFVRASTEEGGKPSRIDISFRNNP